MKFRMFYKRSIQDVTRGVLEILAFFIFKITWKTLFNKFFREITLILTVWKLYGLYIIMKNLQNSYYKNVHGTLKWQNFLRIIEWCGRVGKAIALDFEGAWFKSLESIKSFQNHIECDLLVTLTQVCIHTLIFNI